MNKSLYELTEQQRAIEETLYETGGEVTPELEALMTETKEALPTKVDGYNHIIVKLSAMEDACDKEIKRLQTLKKTAQNGQKSIKEHLLYAMQTFGFERLEGSTCKVYRRASEAVEVQDEARLWSGYEGDLDELRKRLPPWLALECKVSKTNLKTVLKAGDLVPGAALTKNESVIVK